ncbi:MAG: hypothetical protein JW384_02628 [Nitrosomonadaceae bacterium]|jgi:hypothetical protein|nr:hypothetical protein [Nitrosomonadaceae bacterium]
MGHSGEWLAQSDLDARRFLSELMAIASAVLTVKSRFHASAKLYIKRVKKVQRSNLRVEPTRA